MKKLFAGLLVLCLLLSFAACAKTSEPESNPGAETQEKIVIGMAMNTIDEYQTTVLNYAKAYAAEQDVELIITNAEGSVEKQISDVESLIVQSVNCIYLNALDPDGLVDVVERAVAAGIPVVEGGYKINTTAAPSIGTSRYAMGKVQYDYLASYLDANPDETLYIGYLWGYETVKGCQDMYAGVFENLEANYPGRYQIMTESVTNFVVDNAISAMEAWTTSFPQINCIVSQNDEMIVAAVNVYESAGQDVTNMILIGSDGSANARTYIRDGKISATAYTDLEYLTHVKLDYCISAAKGEALPTEDIAVAEATKLMSKDNIDEIEG